MEGYDYDAAARTIKIRDITSDEINRKILRRLKENDPTFDKLWVTDSRDDDMDYCPEGARDLGWVGYYISRITTLMELYFYSNPFPGFIDAIEPFCRGVNCNRSIQKISFMYMDMSGGEIFQSLRPFFENNHNLSELRVDSCGFGPGCALSFLLIACSKYLKTIHLSDIGVERGGLMDIIQALSAHPQVEKLELEGMNIERNECEALANLLRSTATNVQELNLRNNDIDDEGVDALVGALTNNSRLGVLVLSINRISARGCQSLAGLLESKDCNLEELYLQRNNIGNEGAQIFANALTSNNKLKRSSLHENGITAVGYSSFSKVLCDTSSINNTFHSNHTLESLGHHALNAVSPDLVSLLTLNRSGEDEKQIAIKKILKHHRHFDMQPFFEWDLKVLPLAVNWFERARSIEDADEAVLDKRKLCAIYQFIRAMPDVFEPAPAAGEKRKRAK